jgi:hypothetical protein
MTSFKTVAVPKAKPLKLSAPKPPRMPSMSLPSMKTGSGPKLPRVSLPKAAAAGRAPSVRATPMSSRIAYAASSSSPAALTAPVTGYKKQRDQAL